MSGLVMMLPPKDKIKHFLVSFVLTALIYWISKNLILGILVAVLFGLVKELYDQLKGKNTTEESAADFAINILGIIFGILSIYLLGALL